MIPRIEQKLEFPKSKYTYFLNWLKNKKAKILYPERIICSRYLDNDNLQMYYDTVEGIVPRKKIRIRTYNSTDFINSNSPYSFEIKSTTEYKRLKKIEKNINHKVIIDNGFFDNNYGLCTEKVDVSYSREYFIIKDVRITIDRDIKYKLLDNNKYLLDKIFHDMSYVLELKTSASKSITELSNLFDFPRSRFSKYERAIENLFF